MSAFVVHDQVINRIVSWVVRESNDHPWIRREVSEAADIVPYDEQWEEKLGASLFLLNCQGVDARYGPDSAKDFRKLDYNWGHECSTSIQTLKSIECWLYQCSEGDIPETSKLYQLFDRLKGWLACKIVSGLPAYEKAEW